MRMRVRSGAKREGGGGGGGGGEEGGAEVSKKNKNPTQRMWGIKMQGFHVNSLGKPWHRHAYKPYSCSVARKMHGFYTNSHYKPWHRHAYKPYQLLNCA